MNDIYIVNHKRYTTTALYNSRLRVQKRERMNLGLKINHSSDFCGFVLLKKHSLNSIQVDMTSFFSILFSEPDTFCLKV